jgi:hypothetical protein
MTYFLIAGGLVAAIFAYASGRYRGFSEGYFAALIDHAIAEPVEDDRDDAYLAVYGDQIDAGRKGRN